jgi:hypothetical protein
MATRTSSCNCGQLSLAYEGPDPERISLCQCYECQRRTGSVLSVQARMPREQVTIEGQSTTWTFPSEDGEPVTFRTCDSSGATYHFGDGITSAEPGLVEALQLTVFDIDAARADLAARGVEVSEIFHDAGGVFHHARTEGRVSGPAPEHADYGSFASFSDPDGNGSLLQEIKVRLPGRVSGMATRCDGASDLSKALQRAAMAHGEHEARTGEADPDCPDWYADYMVCERAGEELPV